MEDEIIAEVIDQKPEFDIRAVLPEDLDNLRPILCQSIIDSETSEPINDEIDSVLSDIKGSIEGTNTKQYLVAHDSNNIAVGIMGIEIPKEHISSFATTENPLEIINAFIDPQYRGSGIGKELVNDLENIAKSKNVTEILVTSGPRYQKTGWGFWSSIYGEPISTVKDYYGPGLNAPVWKKYI